MTNHYQQHPQGLAGNLVDRQHFSSHIIGFVSIHTVFPGVNFPETYGSLPYRYDGDV